MSLVEELRRQYADNERDFTEWNLAHQNLCYENLKAATFAQANLSYANLTSAILEGTDLSGANLNFANLTAANLSNANLQDADLEGATLTNANLNQAVYNQKTRFPQGFNPTDSGAVLYTSPTEITESHPSEIQPDRTTQPSISTHSVPETLTPVVASDVKSSRIAPSNAVISPNQNQTAPNSATPTIEHQAAPTSAHTNQHKQKLWWMPLLLLSLIGGGIGIRNLLTPTPKLALIQKYEQYMQDENYKLCSNDIADEIETNTYSSDIVQQLKSLQNQCLDKHYGLILQDGTELFEQQDYRAAIETLAKVPENFSRHPQALEQIQDANYELCGEIRQQAFRANTLDEFQQLLDQGYRIAHLTQTPGPCDAMMTELKDSWNENIPELEEAYLAVSNQNCEAIQAYGESMERSIFQKWNRDGHQLNKKAKACYSALRRQDRTNPTITRSFRSFPRNACGDPPPAHVSPYPINYYPLYASYSTRQLRYINANYCRDAYKMRRENGQISIQIASFASRDRARQFANQLRGVNGLEIGLPTTR